MIRETGSSYRASLLPAYACCKADLKQDLVGLISKVIGTTAAQRPGSDQDYEQEPVAASCAPQLHRGRS
jgi:hypothetical protein